ERADFNLTLEHIADLYGADNSQKKLADYTLAGAYVSYEAAQFVDVFLRVENLLNASYQTIYGYPMPGRTLFAGLNLHLGTEG
ncbi:MAG TPA: TonB-dependent receptor, partial [Candidatus Kryptobacter bacterium]|nr:TonB-dependent receptor [Candidatus Kryptobacter bacterium]